MLFIMMCQNQILKKKIEKEKKLKGLYNLSNKNEIIIIFLKFSDPPTTREFFTASCAN